MRSLFLVGGVAYVVEPVFEAGEGIAQFLVVGVLGVVVVGVFVVVVVVVVVKKVGGGGRGGFL